MLFNPIKTLNPFKLNHKTIYNSYLLLASSPLAPNGNSSLDEFVLEGWDGAGDNMAVDVNGKGEMGITGLNGEGKIPLSAVGDAHGYAELSSVGGVG